MAQTQGGAFPVKLLFAILGVVIILVLISISMARTSSTEYCISCHELKRYKDELEKSSHALDEDDRPIGCKQCHIPNEFGPEYVVVKLLGLKDVYVHLFGDIEHLDRREMQEFARRFIPDENCLACHENLYQNTAGKEISETGRVAHESYEGKNGQTRSGCAGCHQNLAHLPRFDRWYQVNAAFAENFPLEEEQ